MIFLSSWVLPALCLLKEHAFGWQVLSENALALALKHLPSHPSVSVLSPSIWCNSLCHSSAFQTQSLPGKFTPGHGHGCLKWHGLFILKTEGERTCLNTALVLKWSGSRWELTLGQSPVYGSHSMAGLDFTWTLYGKICCTGLCIHKFILHIIDYDCYFLSTLKFLIKITLENNRI